MSPSLYVPECPTLFPRMLWHRDRPGRDFPPFDGGRTHWFYFARNAVWHLARRLRLDRGEVLVPSYHHGVEIEALVHAGAQPVFYRVDQSWQVDLDDLEAKLGSRTRAIYLIHYAGFPGPAAAMKRLAERHGVPLIEDCALSLLSSDGSTPLGSVGDYGIFCLYKTLPVPNGGALTVNGDDDLALPALPPPPPASVFSHTASALLKNIEMRGGRFGRAARSTMRRLGHRAVRAGGVERVATGTMHFAPEHLELGISPLTLRLARGQDFIAIVERRRRNYRILRDALGDLAPPLFETLPPGVCPLFYPLECNDKQALLQRLWAHGIEAIDFWRDYHRACSPAQFPDTMRARQRIVEIPCHQDLDGATMQRIAGLVRAAMPPTKSGVQVPDIALQRRSRLTCRSS